MFRAPAADVQPGKKGLVLVHETPSDHRAFKNFQAMLKNEGGLQKSEDCERCRKPKAKEHDPAECLVGRGIGTEGLSDDDVLEMHQMAHDDD